MNYYLHVNPDDLAIECAGNEILPEFLQAEVTEELYADYTTHEGKYLKAEYKDVGVEEVKELITPAVYETVTIPAKTEVIKNPMKNQNGENVTDLEGNIVYIEETVVIEPAREEQKITQEAVYNTYTKTKRVLVPILNPNYEQEEKAREQARIYNLSMTRSDFFDGTIKAFGADADDLLKAIEKVLTQLKLDIITQKIAVNNYKNALNFYRKHTLFDILSSTPIPVSDKLLIIVTAEQWDKFFDLTNQKDPDAYKALIPEKKITL